MEEAQWELCKENAQPLKKGRSTTKAFGGFQSATVKSEMEEIRSEFEKRLSNRDLNLSEKMDIFVEYYTWIRRSANFTLDHARTILEVCVKYYDYFIDLIVPPCAEM
jgi:hypothetical protein